MDDDLAPARKPSAITLGEDLSRLSIADLEQRITDCESEIDRIRKILAGKRTSQSAAELFFRK